MSFSTQGIKILLQSKDSIEYQAYVLIKYGMIIGKIIIRNTGKRIHVWFYDKLNPNNNWYDSHQFDSGTIFENKRMLGVDILEGNKWESYMGGIKVTVHNALF